MTECDVYVIASLLRWGNTEREREFKVQLAFKRFYIFLDCHADFVGMAMT
jgi:hypothetical protein